MIFYYASDGKTICLPLGTVTIQETKAPAGYQLNNTVFVAENRWNWK
ncbi:MAG: prealbumin-like fold domain-containing protein [Ruminococcus sp.]